MTEMSPIATSYDGFKFVVESEVDRAVLGYGEFSNLKILKRLASKDRIFVDVGANLGYYTVRLAQFFKTVYAFEPEPNNFSKLKKSIELNNITNVSLFNFALGSKNEELDFYAGGTGSTFLKGYLNVPPIKVRVAKGDDILPSADIIKIDVEGFEYEVIKGLAKTIHNFNPYLLIEHHDFRHYHINLFPMIESFLRGEGYFWLFTTNAHRLWVNRKKPISEYKFALFHHWFTYCIKNIESGRPWYYGLPYTWWYGMNLIDFYYELPNHLDKEDAWLELVLKQ
jgi:FkbM family methyltransferase